MNNLNLGDLDKWTKEDFDKLVTYEDCNNSTTEEELNQLFDDVTNRNELNINFENFDFDL